MIGNYNEEEDVKYLKRYLYWLGVWVINPFLFLCVLALGGCGLGTYHYVWNREEPEVLDRRTGEPCPRSVTQFTEDYVIDIYGKDCQVIVRRKVDNK